MKKLNKLALSVALAVGTSVAAAGTITGGTAGTVGAETSVNGYENVEVAKGSIAISLEKAIRANDELTITLSSGAYFAGGQGDFVLFASNGGEAVADLTDADDFGFFEATSTQLTFIASGSIVQSSGNIFYLSASDQAGVDEVAFDLPAATAGTSVTLTAATTGTDTFALGANIFGYIDQFSAEVSGAFDAVIDAIDGDRLAFTGGGSDAIDLTFTRATALVSETPTDEDTIIVTLNGDMTGIGSVLLQPWGGGASTAGVISLANQTATVRASAPDGIFGDDTILEITPNASVVMAPREFTVTAVLDLADEETSKTLFTAEDAGALTINGASGRVAQMSLNYGFVQWVKVANRADEPAAIEVDITVGGTTYEGLSLKTLPARSVATISGAEIEAALETAGGPTTGADASLLFTVPVAPSLVDFHSEKKATDGRTITNVVAPPQ